MGGVENDEPASKRLKLVSGRSTGLSNGSSLTEPLVGSSRDLMARPLQYEGDKEVLGSKGVIKRVEFVRIIGKALQSLGYKKSCAYLEEESGIPLHSSAVDLFMKQILNGNWDESVITLHNLGLKDENVVKSASFLLLEQKFFELLDGDKIMDALKTMKTEIAPLCINNGRLLELSSCIVAATHCDSVGSSNQDNGRIKPRSKLLEELQKVLPPTVIMPENRLEHLVEQALTLQQDACIFHNSLDKEMSLYSDHKCGRDQIPSRILQILEAHSDEVWFLQFSHNGKYLASSSNDRSAIIWEIDENGGVSLKHRLSGHQKPVSSVSWSPNDHQLLTCGVEEVVRRWDVSSGECLQVYEKVGLGLVSCGWFPDGKWIFSGINDKSISMWELDGKEVECWKGKKTLKISDLEITSDGKQIISMCRESAILLLDREAKVERVIEENQTITSFSLSRDNRFLLVNLLNQEIHLWSIDGNFRLVAKYNGHKRSRFVIRSCFGGLEQAFIASGSEDSQCMPRASVRTRSTAMEARVAALEASSYKNQLLLESQQLLLESIQRLLEDKFASIEKRFESIDARLEGSNENDGENSRRRGGLDHRERERVSELASVTCLELADVCREVGLPPGVLNILTGLGTEAGAPLASHPHVDKVAFTESNATGSRIMASAAQMVKPVSMELGGKSPIIVFEDVDLDKAAEWTLFGCFWTNDQICSATSRLLVHESIASEFLDRHLDREPLQWFQWEEYVSSGSKWEDFVKIFCRDFGSHGFEDYYER